MQDNDTMQPETLTEEASHLNKCIGHLHNLVNLPVTEFSAHDGIETAADKAYLEAHQFDPREILMKGKTYTGMKLFPDSASDLEIRPSIQGCGFRGSCDEW